MRWELWSTDTFDRDAAPSCEATGDDFLAGCAGLWRATVDQGVLADGKPSFTWYQLRWAGGALSLPRDPFSNPELRALKPWVTTVGVIGALAQALAASPDDGTVRRCLALVAAAADPWDLCQRLGHPAPRPEPKRRFDFTQDAQVLAFLASPAASEAKFLTLKTRDVGASLLEALAASDRLRQVEFLSFGEVPMGDEGLAWLATAKWPKLARLVVSACGVGDAGVAALAQAPWAAGLTELHLANASSGSASRPNRVGDAGARALAQSPLLARLARLDLGHNPVGNAGVEALLAKGALPALQELVVWRTGLTAEGAARCAVLAGQRSRGCVVHSDFTPRVVDFSAG